MMTGWHKIEAGWYEHDSGAIVQYWRRSHGGEKTGWYAWTAETSDMDHTAHKTLLEAMAAALRPGAVQAPEVER